jgi:hypothetical protein
MVATVESEVKQVRCYDFFGFFFFGRYGLPGSAIPNAAHTLI